MDRKYVLLPSIPSNCSIDPFEVLQQELELLDYTEEHLIPIIPLVDRQTRLKWELKQCQQLFLQNFIDSNSSEGYLCTIYTAIRGHVTN